MKQRGDGPRPEDFDALVSLYVKLLDLQDHADAEAYAADDALAGGYVIAAEQHFAYSSTYRQRADKVMERAEAVLAGWRQDLPLSKVASLAEQALGLAQQRVYGESVPRRPYVE